MKDVEEAFPHRERGGYGGIGSEEHPTAPQDEPATRTEKWWKDATRPPLPLESTNVNLTNTLPYMEGRKSLRRFRGAYMKTRPLLAWFLLLLLLAVWTFRSSTIASQSVSAQFELQLGLGTQNEILYVILLVLVVMYMLFSIQLMTHYNLAYSWVITLLFVLLSIADVILAIHFPEFAADALVFRDILLVLFLFVQGLYAVTSYFLQRWLPYLQMQGWFLVKVSLLDETSESGGTSLKAMIPKDQTWRAVPATGILASSSFTYVQMLLPLFRLCTSKRDTITYKGEVDADGHPHGFGVWTDTHWHGETLEGWWEHGIPVAPFKARETGSGSGFKAIRIGYIRCRKDHVRELQFLPKFSPITVGIASAECSVSGFFFRDYPVVRFMSEPLLPETIASCHGGHEPPEVAVAKKTTPVQFLKVSLDWLMKYMTPMAPDASSSSVVVHSDRNRGLSAGGFIQDTPAADRGKIHNLRIHAVPGDAPDAFSGLIDLNGWKSCYSGQHREAVLYIHGYNSPTDWGIKGIGQLMCLGNFPSYLRPFVFSWPAGQLFAFLAAKRASVALDTTQALIDTLTAFDEAGFDRVHILTHSMGVRVLTSSIPQLQQLMTPTAAPIVPDDAAYTEAHLTPAGIPTMKNGMSISTITILNPEHGLVDFLKYYAKPIRNISPLVTIFGDTRDTALLTAAVWNSLDATFITQDGHNRMFRSDQSETYVDGVEDDGTCCCGGIVYERSLGRHLYMIQGPYNTPLDIDIIDTTFLDANMSQHRHNSFSLNRDMVEDLRDIMTTGRRASQRSRLEARGNNLYSFMVAPSHVVQPILSTAESSAATQRFFPRKTSPSI
eukprot:CAMPEP_0117656872 /NCGR_PEP_ID=MMETSP0804-20121206/5033_1 /TAXON_ID=1074897 /ORGANISM="Tetraselmis astigmatica, Strain CCMP880" /LENGTH=835 /DNA_ID=CAMNT_0005463297 /DNA_START=232 /DNA_END=2740 /DNA_ORIENTATION=+